MGMDACLLFVFRVTNSSAIVLIEVGEACSLTCVAKGENGDVHEVTAVMQKRIPRPFVFSGLRPATRYTISFLELAPGSMEGLVSTFKTFPLDEDIHRLRFAALSCDRFTRLKDDDENPWRRILQLLQEEECDVVLHLGDQVYTCQWGYLTRAYQAMSNHDAQCPAIQLKMKRRALDYIRDAYRDTWNMPFCKEVMARESHLMLWSDNDVANDFTILKDSDGNQAYTDEFLTCAMKVYREYQRQLWDPSCDGKLPAPHEPLEEFQFHQYGPCGVFLLDMRGNRITSNGIQKDDLIMSQNQVEALISAFAQPSITFMILAAEIPFVGDDPITIKDKAKDLVFLNDHWPSSPEEQNFILELCFDWRAARTGREVLLLSGDIHVGVESQIFDSMTGTTIKAITTSPITNHVCPFFPELEGRINERFSYQHKPLLDHRNFCTVDVQFDPVTRAVTSLNTTLVPVPTSAFLKTAKQKECERKKMALMDGGAAGKLAKFTQFMKQNSENSVHIPVAGTPLNLSGLLSHGGLLVTVHRCRDLPDTSVISRTITVVEVEIGPLKFKTLPCDGGDPQNPKWEKENKTPLEFKLGEHTIARFVVWDTANNVKIGRADFPLDPFFKGWTSFKGEIPVIQGKRRSEGFVEISLELKENNSQQ